MLHHRGNKGKALFKRYCKNTVQLFSLTFSEDSWLPWCFYAKSLIWCASKLNGELGFWITYSSPVNLFGFNTSNDKSSDTSIWHSDEDEN